jgi:hypothetical protein
MPKYISPGFSRDVGITPDRPKMGLLCRSTYHYLMLIISNGMGSLIRKENSSQEFHHRAQVREVTLKVQTQYGSGILT